MIGSILFINILQENMLQRIGRERKIFLSDWIKKKLIFRSIIFLFLSPLPSFSHPPSPSPPPDSPFPLSLTSSSPHFLPTNSFLFLLSPSICSSSSFSSHSFLLPFTSPIPSTIPLLPHSPSSSSSSSLSYLESP